MNANAPVSPMRPAAVSGSLQYPAQRLGWLHKFCSLLDRAEVAREIGRDAMLFILAIAVQEDVLRYASPPILFDSELQRLTGIRSRKHLDRIRQKAVDSGWLAVVRSPDGDPLVAQYWTLIPQRLHVFDVPAVVRVVAETADVRAGLQAHADDGNSKSALTPQACPVQAAEPVNELRPSTDSCPPESLSSSEGPSGDAEVEVHLGSADVPVGPASSPGPDSVNVNTSDVVPARSEVPVNEPVAADRVASHSVSGITVAIQAAEVALVPCQSVAEPPAPKKLTAYPPHIREQAGDLLRTYPCRRDLDKGLPSICRALEKISYHKLRPRVALYAAARNRPGQDPKLTPSAATWFDEERWREDVGKWEIRDQHLLKKKA